jgi:hypothetical protein
VHLRSEAAITSFCGGTGPVDAFARRWGVEMVEEIIYLMIII